MLVNFSGQTLTVHWYLRTIFFMYDENGFLRFQNLVTSNPLESVNINIFGLFSRKFFKLLFAIY